MAGHGSHATLTRVLRLRAHFPDCLLPATHGGIFLPFATAPGMCAICGSGSACEPRRELRLPAGYSAFSTTLIGTATK
jgi:hypothetical protein